MTSLFLSLYNLCGMFCVMSWRSNREMVATEISETVTSEISVICLAGEIAYIKIIGKTINHPRPRLA